MNNRLAWVIQFEWGVEMTPGVCIFEIASAEQGSSLDVGGNTSRGERFVLC